MSRHCLRNFILIAIIGACSGRQLLRAQSCANPIACENLLPPGKTDWQISGSGDSDIQGFATDISVNVGQTVSFKIKTTASNYTIDIFRLGYYGGAGARYITTISPSASLPQTQPACLTDTSTNLMDCGNWAVSASWPVPSNAVSGYYFAHLIRSDNGHESHIFWIVREDPNATHHSDILFQATDQTWAAYNDYGGHSLDCRPNLFMTALTMKAHDLPRRPEWGKPAADRLSGDSRSVCDVGVGDCGRRRRRARAAELTNA